MSSPGTASGMQGARADQAAQWYMLLQASELQTDDLKAWQEWSRDAANQLAFDEIARIAGLAPALKGSSANASSPAPGYRGFASEKRKWLAAAAVLLGLGGAVVYWQSDALRLRDTYHTSVAEHRTVRLSDGSSIHLGGRTSVSISFTDEQRRIVLQSGEALFAVARDSRRPFTVVAGGSAITALGTVFNVNSDAEQVTVKVAEGRVQVTKATGDFARMFDGDRRVPTVIATLERGEEATYGLAARQPRIAHIEPQEASAWRQGRLQYRDEQLKHVAADVNRYSSRRIVFADGDAERLIYTGTVYRDRIDEWVQGLSDLYGVRIEEVGADLVRVHSSARPPR